MKDVEIRRSAATDHAVVRAIIADVVEDGETYAFETVDAMMDWWMTPDGAAYVAQSDNAIVRGYLIEPNQPGRGSHVAHAGYFVHQDWRSRGLGRAMLTHSLDEAKRLGYHAMQYNLIASTNTPSIRMCLSMGFEIIGTATQAFRHKDRGLIDAHILYRLLDVAT
jgi:L-amino acid N-acyltransferase YncA